MTKKETAENKEFKKLKDKIQDYLGSRLDHHGIRAWQFTWDEDTATQEIAREHLGIFANPLTDCTLFLRLQRDKEEKIIYVDIKLIYQNLEHGRNGQQLGFGLRVCSGELYEFPRGGI